ncbi:hypothetical protein OKW21_001389 [Catalinimonas alkaloidigena]|uniref:hypothetical protein n=1 Tax=Catalinimonas alkaloidigena TaxID=1075417 RepID=UPI00240682D6|nr:hypothetical protein [Catalinimonas alkaloidigena]MDF9796126.1 hypothetical protein [Catalinimonas alkaloidigena]
MNEGRIKIKDIEGDAKQITNLCKDLGFDISTYLNQKPVKKTISKTWLAIIIPCFFILSCVVWIGLLNPVLTKISILALFLLLGTTIFIIQHNYENWIISTIAGITGLCLILISLNIYTPEELAKKLERKALDEVKSSEN